MVKPKRPIVRYHGGKWKLAPWIIGHFPEHRIYTEAFGGGASVLLRKPRAYAEIYNDLDGEIVNLFKVARDNGHELKQKIELTPFSRDEFIEAYEPSDCPIEQARRTVIRSFMGFGSSAVTKTRKTTSRVTFPNTGFRANSNRSGTTPAHDWKSWPDHLPDIIDRLRGVVIENRDAKEVISAHDSEQTLHYIDPPYLPDTRDKGSDYKHEMTENDHIELAKFIHSLKGKVIISGYPSLLYDDLYKVWRVEKKSGALADRAAFRTECLWMNFESNRLI